MSSEGQGITRRGALANIAGGVAAAAVTSRFGFGATPGAKVVRVESKHVWNGDKRDPRVVAEMIDKGLVALTGKEKPGDAWKQFFRPGMRVGLKINLLGRPLICTAREVTDAVAAAAVAAGVRPADLIVWDRWKDHFGPSEYAFGKGKFGEEIVAGGSYDPKWTLKASGGTAQVDTIASQRTDVTISLPLMKDHSGSGVTLALKNIAFGCYDHHDKAHDNHCDPFIAEAYRDYVSRTKAPLIVLDATLACADGGPRPRGRESLWRENAIYVATDPVALDATCRKVIMARRAEMKLSDKMAATVHIETAAKFGLGVGDPARIDVVTINV